jgi:hypothetical protein
VFYAIMLTMPRHRSARLATALAVVAVLVLAGAVVATSLRSHPAATARTSVSPRATAPRRSPAAPSERWAGVLRRLDARRSAAWRAGDPRRLAAVFAQGSSPLRRDRALLREYVHRRLGVSRATVSYLRVRLVGRSPGRVTLATVDQLDAVEVDRASAATVMLPADQPSRHRIVLVAAAAGWRIAAVRTY